MDLIREDGSSHSPSGSDSSFLSEEPSHPISAHCPEKTVSHCDSYLPVTGPTTDTVFMKFYRNGATDPSKVLIKIFPYLDPVILNSVLRNCQGDLVRAIEILSPHSMTKLSDVRRDYTERSTERQSEQPGMRSAFSPARGMQGHKTCTYDKGPLGHLYPNCFVPLSSCDLTNHKYSVGRSYRSSFGDYFRYLTPLEQSGKVSVYSQSGTNYENNEQLKNIRIDETLICKECKSPARSDDQFCRGCGMKL